MLDERRIKLMTQLALYEETSGKQDFKISAYYRKDYVGMHTICSILWVTVGYACILALVGIVAMDSILSNLSNGLVLTLAIGAALGYLFLLILYIVIENHLYNGKHKNARQGVKKYNHDLSRLLKLYEREKK